MYTYIDIYVYVCVYIYIYIYISIYIYYIIQARRSAPPGPRGRSLRGGTPQWAPIYFFANFADDGEHSLAEANVYYTRLAEPIQNWPPGAPILYDITLRSVFIISNRKFQIERLKS